MQHHGVCSFAESEMVASASGMHLEIIVFSTLTCIVELKRNLWLNFAV
jgi:hypothetical protein